MQVPGCKDSCNEYFRAASAEQLSWEDVDAFYSMPATLREGVLAEAAGQVILQKLHSTFGCLEEVVRDPDLWVTFLQLPKGAVEALAAMDNLQVVSENTVALAVACWLAAHESRLPAAPELLNLLRLHHLTHSFLRHVLRHLAGLGEALTLQHCLDAWGYAAAPASCRSSLYQGFKPARQCPASTELSFQWRVRVSDVVNFIQAQIAPDSNEESILRSNIWHWYNGFKLGIFMFTRPSAPSPRVLHACVVATCSTEGGLSNVPSVDIQGSVSMHAGPDGAQLKHSQLMLYGSKADNATRFLAIQLGQDHVHDAASLMAAIVAPGPIVVGPQPPVSIELAATPELLLTCTITSCK